MDDTAGDSSSKRFRPIAPKPPAWVLPSTYQHFAALGQSNPQLLTQLHRTAFGTGVQGPQKDKPPEQSAEARARRRQDKRNIQQRRRRLEAKQKQEAEGKQQKRARTRTLILAAQGGTDLDDETLSVLLRMWDEGELRDGTGDLDGGLQGSNNGMFFGLLSMAKAPPPRYRTAGGDDESFWSAGEARKHYTRKAFLACMAAGFPFILEGDAPLGSVMGTASRHALDAGFTRLGNLGGRSGTAMFNLKKTFVDRWVEGHVGPGLLSNSFGRSSTWTIQNVEEDALVDRKSLTTIRCEKAMKLVQKTRMGGLCYPARASHQGGELVKGASKGNESWAGSECTAFASVAGSVTNAHVSSQLVHGEELFVPAAGFIQCVDGRIGGAARRAVVMCAHDMDRVVDVLRLDISRPPGAQHRGADLDVESLAGKLKENGIKFVACEIPADCSYAIPPRCAHMFVNLRLVESCVWHPAL
ncbi:unnamed protein product [Scytosiphon promiscuus]